MSAPATPRTDDRDFEVWEYQISHAQLLIRSPEAPATDASERRTNVDVSENNWDIFDSPFEFRSQFRGGTPNSD